MYSDASGHEVEAIGRGEDPGRGGYQSWGIMLLDRRRIW
jgi:hypothetical protein